MMDDQINRTILDNFDVATVGNGQGEINKLSTPGVLRGIEGGALHFVTVPNRDQEFIDHSFLNPEYIATHIANGFIIDLMNNQDGGDQQQPSNFINETISNDLEFQNDEQDHKLTATFLQIVNKQCSTIKNGNEAQVIVNNKELGTLTQTNETAKQNAIDHNFLTIDDQQAFPSSLLSDSQLKIYQNPHQLNVHPPLPPLTPIRRLNSPRKNINVNNSAASKSEFNSNSISNLKNNQEVSVEDSRVQRPLAKKSLPHKKRITKKLKTIDKSDQQGERSTLFSEEPEVEDESIVLNTLQFSCQLCGHASESQLDFFAHLKGHYEPVITETTNECVASKPDKVLSLEQGLPSVEISLEGFEDEILSRDKNETCDQHESVKVIQADSNSDNSGKDVNISVAEVEFSDTEDMLEGIRGVVAKVQESVDNDTNDGMDIISEKTWFTNSALNGDIHFKTGDTVNNHITQQSVDNFSLFFKNNLEKGTEESQNILPNLDDDKLSEQDEKDMELEGSSNPDCSKQETIKGKRKHRKAKTRKEDSRDLSENWDSSEPEEKSKPKKRIQCTKCNKLFNSANALKYHDLSHTGERPHQCEVCGKSFFALSALKVHMRMHSGIKPYPCELCNRAFRQWGDLKYHIISIHTNERNFQCEFCGKAFARRYSLVVHRRIHTSERNYKCEFCPKTFRASSYLQNHRKVHTGEKPYSCKVCGKKFRVSGDLKRHTNIHSRDKKRLKSHLTLHHESQVVQPKQQINVDEVKKEPIVTQDSNELKPEAVTEDNRAASLTIFYHDESLDIFKTEPTFEHSSVNDLQPTVDNDSPTEVPATKLSSAKKKTSKDTGHSTKSSDKEVPVRTEESESIPNDLGKMLQKGTNLVYFW